MKLITMLFAAVALASAPAFAEDDLCAVQLQKIDNQETQTMTLGSPTKEQVEELTQQAKDAQSAGDTKSCISHSAQAIQLLESSKSNGTNSN